MKSGEFVCLHSHEMLEMVTDSSRIESDIILLFGGDLFL